MMRAVEVSIPAEAVRKTLGTWGVQQSGWRSVAAVHTGGPGEIVVTRWSIVLRTMRQRGRAAAKEKETYTAVRASAARAVAAVGSSAAGASLFGRQATLRGCDGRYAHYPLAQWRNGQWADPMLAHAGTEAVRLVPFSSLLLSAESLSEYRSSAWRLPLCQDAVCIMIS